MPVPVPVPVPVFVFACACICVCVYVCVCTCAYGLITYEHSALFLVCNQSNNKDVAAMLVELRMEANEESFVIVLQHGGNDVTCKRSVVLPVSGRH